MDCCKKTQNLTALYMQYNWSRVWMWIRSLWKETLGQVMSMNCYSAIEDLQKNVIYARVQTEEKC